jgi:ribosome-associated protein
LSAGHVEVKFAVIVTKQKTTRKKKTTDETQALLDAIVFGMQEVKANDIVQVDLRKLSHAMADYFVVCHGTSNTQVQALADSVEREVQKMTGEKPMHVEGNRNAKWVLMDYINVVVHIFDPESRNFYDLESLWADGETKRIE